IPHSASSANQLHHSGNSCPISARKNTAPPVVLVSPSNSQTHTDPTRYPMLNRFPQFVRLMPVTIAPNPAATKSTPNISPRAGGFHVTHAESASASSESTRIQIHDPIKMPLASRAFVVAQVQPSRFASSRNSSSPGTQVSNESKIASTSILLM